MAGLYTMGPCGLCLVNNNNNNNRDLSAVVRKQSMTRSNDSEALCGAGVNHSRWACVKSIVLTGWPPVQIYLKPLRSDPGQVNASPI